MSRVRVLVVALAIAALAAVAALAGVIGGPPPEERLVSWDHPNFDAETGVLTVRVHHGDCRVFDQRLETTFDDGVLVVSAIAIAEPFETNGRFCSLGCGAPPPPPAGAQAGYSDDRGLSTIVEVEPPPGGFPDSFRLREDPDAGPSCLYFDGEPLLQGNEAPHHPVDIVIER